MDMDLQEFGEELGTMYEILADEAASDVCKQYVAAQGDSKSVNKYIQQITGKRADPSSEAGCIPKEKSLKIIEGLFGAAPRRATA